MRKSKKIQERTNTTYIHGSWTPQYLGSRPQELDKELTLFEITLVKKKYLLNDWRKSEKKIKISFK